MHQCNGQPVAKLSDSPGKILCDDQTFLAYLRQVFHVSAPAFQATAARVFIVLLRGLSTPG